MDVFIARQPIFDRNKKVYAYELLFRSSLENYFSHPDADEASSKVIADSVLVFDMNQLLGGRKAFVNVTGKVLLKEYTRILPKDMTVVEILETVEPSDKIVAACRKLKKAGYTLALDDFVYEDRFQPLVDLADIVKIDFLATDPAARRDMEEKLSNLKLLAEKVETQDEFDQALSAGYEYFQGYFFAKPVVIVNRDVSPQKMHYLRLLHELHSPDLDFQRLENVIKSDMALSYKLLRYINSPFFGTRGQIESIQQALLLLGTAEIKKWATVLALAAMGDDKPRELVLSAVMRARICETLARKLGRADQGQAMFLMGMFSVIDAIMDKPLDELLREMPIAADVKDALLGKTNWYRNVFNVTLCYEKGDWEGFSACCADVNLPEGEVPDVYIETIQWASESLGV